MLVASSLNKSPSENSTSPKEELCDEGLTTKLQPARHIETSVQRTGLPKSQFSKNMFSNGRSTHVDMRAKSRSAPHNETSVQQTGLPKIQFSKRQQCVDTVSHESSTDSIENFDLYNPYQPTENARVAKSKNNYTAQPPDPSESVSYGSTFESQNVSLLPVQSKTGYSGVRKNIWPDSWNSLMSNVAPKPVLKPSLNVDKSRGKYLLSLAQNYKNL